MPPVTLLRDCTVLTIYRRRAERGGVCRLPDDFGCHNEIYLILSEGSDSQLLKVSSPPSSDDHQHFRFHCKHMNKKYSYFLHPPSPVDK